LYNWALVQNVVFDSGWTRTKADGLASMALKKPTPVSPFRAIYLCAIAILLPSKFDALERENSKGLETAPNDDRYRVQHIRQGLFESLIWVIASGAIGYVFGILLCRVVGRYDFLIAAFQVVGAMLLLWATLAVRGWQIQTFSGATLTERVNQWIYRFLYCLGTALVVLTLGWSC